MWAASSTRGVTSTGSRSCCYTRDSDRYHSNERNLNFRFPQHILLGVKGE